MPEGTDCVVDADLLDASGPLLQVLAEAIPGEGVRRAGDIWQVLPTAAGQVIRALDLLAARAAGRVTLSVRQPRVRVINIPAADGSDITARLIVDLARAAGRNGDARRCRGARRSVDCSRAGYNDMRSHPHRRRQRRRPQRCDDHRAGRRPVPCWPMVSPCSPAAPRRLAGSATTPVIALPGASDQALAAWWTLAIPVLDRLSGRAKRASAALPLARKIASSVGVAEIALLQRLDGGWLPLAVGELSLAAVAGADAWCAVPAGSEGYAAATPVDAYMLRDPS